jgi:cellulose synthase/poly-beta-1,6-N-acetylglucosamine synthase-like glycosyltransferase
VRHTTWQPIMTILFSLAFLLLIIYCGLLLYYRQAWKSIPEPVESSQLSIDNYQLSISVIIPARNEASNLYDLLTSLTQQTYPAALFEVIVVDDYSTDDTANIVRNFPAPNIHLISLKEILKEEKINSYKKKAIEIGISQSKGELIVTTDADCFMGKDWLQTIAAFYQTNHPQLIVMPVSINCGNSPVEIFQALDFMSLQGITGASVYKKVHSMCNGANLAYTRKAFDKVKGFEGIDNIASGDDMLLMHKISLQYPNGISYLKSKEVIVHTQTMHTVKDFLNQRIRWASKANKYDDKRITAVLIVVYLLNVLLLVIPLWSIVNRQSSMEESGVHTSFKFFTIHHSPFTYWLLLVAIKTIIELFFLFPVAGFFNKRRLLWLFPLAQPFHILYTVIAGFLGMFGSYQWKDRKVN